MGTGLSQFANAVHWNRGLVIFLRGVCGAIVEMLTDLVTRPAQRESKEQGCNTKLERRGGVEFRPTSDFVTRSEDPKVTTYGFKWC